MLKEHRGRRNQAWGVRKLLAEFEVGQPSRGTEKGTPIAQRTAKVETWRLERVEKDHTCSSYIPFLLLPSNYQLGGLK